MTPPVYINGFGKFLPGLLIPNSEIEDYLGRIHGKPSRARLRILKQNGILTRHYAIDREQRSLYSNAGMAARAVRDLFEKASLDPPARLGYVGGDGARWAKSFAYWPSPVGRLWRTNMEAPERFDQASQPVARAVSRHQPAVK